MEKNLMPVYEKLLSECAEKEFENDFSLPEYCPNILRVAMVCAQSRVKSFSAEGSSVFADIETEYTLVYLSEYKNRLKSVKFCANHSFSVNSKGALPEGISPELCVQVISCTVKSAGQRHISTKTRLSLCVKAQKENNILLFPEEYPEDAEFLSDYANCCVKKELCGLQINIREALRIDDGMPNISELVFAKCAPSLSEIAFSDSKLSVRGWAQIFALYLANGEDENDSQYVCLTKKIPVEAELDAEGLSGCEFAGTLDLQSFNASASADSYGEARIIETEFDLSASVCAYANHTCSFCKDSFCREHESDVSYENINFESFERVHKESVRFETAVKADTKSLNTVLDTSINLYSVQTENMGGKLYLSCRGTLWLLGENSEGNADSILCPVNFKLPLDLSFVENEKYTPACSVFSPLGRIENGEIKLAFEARVFCAVTKKEARTFVRSISENEEKTERKRAFTVYYPSKEDTVWSVAKRYGTSPERICECNGISGSLSGKKIIVIK